MLWDDSILFGDREWTANTEQIGRIEQTSNEVRHKKSQTLVWRRAKEQSLIHTGDSIFTGSQSTSKILLNDGTKIEISPDSLVVVSIEKDYIDFNLEFGSFTGDLTQSKKKLRVIDRGEKVLIRSKKSKIQFQKKKKATSVTYKLLSGTAEVEHKKQKLQLTSKPKKIIEKKKQVDPKIVSLFPNHREQVLLPVKHKRIQCELENIR